MIQLELFPDFADQCFEDDRAKAQAKLDARLAPFLGPLMPWGWDACLDLRKGDLVRMLRCPECRMLFINLPLMKECVCRDYFEPSWSKRGPGYNCWRPHGWNTWRNSGFCSPSRHSGQTFGPIWTEERGWLVAEYDGPLTGRTWEFLVYWIGRSRTWSARWELV